MLRVINYKPLIKNVMKKFNLVFTEEGTDPPRTGGGTIPPPPPPPPPPYK